MKDWKTNRFWLSFIFIATGIYTLFNPKPALEIVKTYAYGRDELDRIEADKDL